MSSAPSLPSAVAKPIFTAYYAHKRAMRTAHRLAAQSDAKVQCKACKGTSKMSFNITQLGDDGKWSPEESSSIQCIHCVDGMVAPAAQYYQALVWCRCKQGRTAGFIRAADGSRIFGKETYLCGSCGFVKQFG